MLFPILSQTLQQKHSWDESDPKNAPGLISNSYENHHEFHRNLTISEASGVLENLKLNPARFINLLEFIGGALVMADSA